MFPLWYHSGNACNIYNLFQRLIYPKKYALKWAFPSGTHSRIQLILASTISSSTTIILNFTDSLMQTFASTEQEFTGNNMFAY